MPHCFQQHTSLSSFIFWKAAAANARLYKHLLVAQVRSKKNHLEFQNTMGLGKLGTSLRRWELALKFICLQFSRLARILRAKGPHKREHMGANRETYSHGDASSTMFVDLSLSISDIHPTTAWGRAAATRSQDRHISCSTQWICATGQFVCPTYSV